MNNLTLSNYLLPFNWFNVQHLQLIYSKAFERQCLMGACLAEVGRVAHKIAFVIGGIFRGCYFDNEGNEISKKRIDKNHCVVDLLSLLVRWTAPLQDLAHATNPIYKLTTNQ